MVVLACARILLWIALCHRDAPLGWPLVVEPLMPTRPINWMLVRDVTLGVFFGITMVMAAQGIVAGVLRLLTAL